MTINCVEQRALHHSQMLVLFVLVLLLFPVYLAETILWSGGLRP